MLSTTVMHTASGMSSSRQIYVLTAEEGVKLGEVGDGD